MAPRRNLAALVAAVAVAVACGAVGGSGAIVEGVEALTVDSFDDRVGGDTIALVMFAGAKCGHCKRLAPNFAELQERVKATAGWENVLIATVNANENMKLATRYKAFPWPSLHLFVDGPAESVPMPDSRGNTGADGVDRMFNFIAANAKLAHGGHDGL